MENQFSNECLCKLIQEGHTEYLFQLWLQCEKFIRMIAEQYVKQYDRGQDLVEDCCQEAFISLSRIAINYRIGSEAAFLTYLKQSLHTTFREVMLSGRGKAEKDPLNNCDSLDRTIINTDGDEQKLMDLIEDEHSEDELREVVDADYRRSQHAFLMECIQLSSEEVGKAILTEMLKSNCGYRDAIFNLFGEDALENEQLVLILRRKKDKAVKQIRQKTKSGKKEALMRKYSLESKAKEERRKQRLLDELFIGNYGLRDTGYKFFSEANMSCVERSVILRNKHYKFK